jgi:hypothetical protein
MAAPLGARRIGYTVLVAVEEERHPSFHAAAAVVGRHIVPEAGLGEVPSFRAVAEEEEGRRTVDIRRGLVAADLEGSRSRSRSLGREEGEGRRIVLEAVPAEGRMTLQVGVCAER